jgi:hypothetical protein
MTFRRGVNAAFECAVNPVRSRVAAGVAIVGQNCVYVPDEEMREMRKLRCRQSHIR